MYKHSSQPGHSNSIWVVSSPPTSSHVHSSQQVSVCCPQVVAYDFGIKHNILRRLASFGCQIIVVPADYPAEKVMQMNPDGVFFSNGPVSLASDSARCVDQMCVCKSTMRSLVAMQFCRVSVHDVCLIYRAHASCLLQEYRLEQVATLEVVFLQLLAPQM